MRVLPAGSTGLLIELDGLEQVLALLDALLASPPEGVVDIVPAARTILLTFDPCRTDAAVLRRAIPAAGGPRRAVAGRSHDIPVAYDGEDLAAVAEHLGWTVAEVVRRHGQATWTAAFAGFAPGFVYMTCDDPGFDVPRRASPRLRVPAGSVALAGRFGGIYPSDSPGGWQIVGRTPLALWDLRRPQPALLAPGDRVRFRDMGHGAQVGVPPLPVPPEPSARGGIEVLRADRPALWQDGGRPGQGGQGLGASGALDRGAFARANLCLGNPPGWPVLEIAFGGFALRVDAAVTMAVTGAPCPLVIRGADGRRSTAPFGRAFALDPGDRLDLGPPPRGMRSYLALRGGFDVPPVLGSAARDTLAGVGPAPVVAGACLNPAGRPAGAVDPFPPLGPVLPGAGDLVVLDILPGPRDDWFTPEGLAALTGQAWTVTPEASRIGIRLNGPRGIERRDAAELPSEGTVTGAIQVPHDGQPVLFLADHPLTGGYPVIAAVAAHHLDLAGQIPPGARLRFNLTSERAGP